MKIFRKTKAGWKAFGQSSRELSMFMYNYDNYRSHEWPEELAKPISEVKRLGRKALLAWLILIVAVGLLAHVLDVSPANWVGFNLIVQLLYPKLELDVALVQGSPHGSVQFFSSALPIMLLFNICFVAVMAKFSWQKQLLDHFRAPIFKRPYSAMFFNCLALFFMTWPFTGLYLGGSAIEEAFEGSRHVRALFPPNWASLPAYLIFLNSFLIVATNVSVLGAYIMTNPANKQRGL